MPGRNRTLALLLTFAALPGCGGGDDDGSGSRPAATVQGSERGILETIDALQTAIRRGEGRRICEEVFTENLARSIETSAKRSCPTEVRKRLFTQDQSISVQQGIKVTGNTATAVIREKNKNVSTLHLVEQAGRWRIDRVTPLKTG